MSKLKVSNKMASAASGPKIAPSILSADFSNLGEELRRIEGAGADWIHIDVMDGNFVPNLTIGPPVIKKIRSCTKLPFDVHLMIERPELSVADYAAAGAQIITVHAEATTHLHRLIHQIKGLGVKVGVSINPSTSLESIREVLNDLDLVLLMSVNPGFGGQKFIEASVDKVKRLNMMRRESGSSFLIEIDGGVQESNVKVLSQAGVEVFVAGAAVFGSGSGTQDFYAANIKKLRKAIAK